MYQIDHRKWEEIIAGAYKQAGCDEVILTPPSGDLGRDIIAVKKGFWTVRLVDQVKAYRPGHLVTAEEVRAFLHVVDAEKSSKGFITTTSDFAPRIRQDQLIKPYIPYRLELVNGKELVQKLDSLTGGDKA